MSQPITQSSLAKTSPWTVRIQFWLLARTLGCPCLQLPPPCFPDPQADPGLIGLLAPKWQPPAPTHSVCLGPSSLSLWWQRPSRHCLRVESTGSWSRGMRMCKAGREPAETSLQSYAASSLQAPGRPKSKHPRPHLGLFTRACLV